MTDRELLEMAAKAAGYELDYSIRPDGLAFYHSDRNAMALADGGWFAPLTDDGDALRLAVKLGLCVDCVPGADVVQYFIESDPENGARSYDIDITNDDRYAATRRAIVRAAAEIGRGMQ